MKKALIRWMEKLKKDERGMTLVELLAVVVILAIVGAIAFVAIGNVIENSKKDAHIANAQQIISAAELYEASDGKLNDNGEINITSIDTLEKVIDPWTKEENGLENFKVTKNGGNIQIESTQAECSFESVSKSTLASEGRKLCGN